MGAANSSANDNDFSDEDGYGQVYWSYPSDLKPEVFYSWTFTEDYENHGVSIPLQVHMGTMGDRPSTAVATDEFVFYLSVDYTEPSELPIFISASILTIISMNNGKFYNEILLAIISELLITHS